MEPEDADCRAVLKRSIADRGGSRDAQLLEEAMAAQPRGGATAAAVGHPRRFPIQDQFEPYMNMFGADMKSHFAGTLFRLPFRTKETPQDSSISKLVFTEKHQKELCTQFKAEARQWLLFPSSIRHIRICFRPQQARRSWEGNGLLQQGGECARWQIKKCNYMAELTEPWPGM